jgi:LPS O-antigen subunit length determinant protein (WzzB/FepE family)
MNNDNENFYEDEIDLKKLFLILWDKKFLIVALTTIAAILSVFYALSLPNIYTSTALLTTSAQEDSLTSKLGGYSGLASFAGINLPGNEASKTEEAIKRIKSFDFFSKFFLKNIQLENLMALEEWVQNGNILIYDEDVFDSKSKKWVRIVSFPQKVIPSDQEAFKKFKAILNIKKDADTGFVTLSIEHRSPIIAKKLG